MNINVIFNIKEVNMSVSIEEIKSNLAEADSEYLATIAERDALKASNAALVAERDALKADVSNLHEQIASLQSGATDADLNALFSMSLTLKNRVDVPVADPVVDVVEESPVVVAETTEEVVFEEFAVEAVADPNEPVVE